METEYGWWSWCLQHPRGCQKWYENFDYWTRSKSRYQQLGRIDGLANSGVFNDYWKLQRSHSKTHRNMKLCWSRMSWGSTKLERDEDSFYFIWYLSLIREWESRYFHLLGNLCWRWHESNTTARRKGIIGIDSIKWVSWTRWMEWWHEWHSICMGLENCPWLGGNGMIATNIKHDLVSGGRPDIG